MEWLHKVKMVQLGNAMNKNVANKKEFQTYVIKHIATFDSQAWDMFFNLVDLSSRKMKNDISFWEKVYPHIKNIDCNGGGYKLKTGMRIGMLQTICEDEFKMK